MSWLESTTCLKQIITKLPDEQLLLKDASVSWMRCKSYKSRWDAKSWLILDDKSTLSVSFLLAVLELVSRVGCERETRGKQVEAWLMIPPLGF